MNDFNHKVRIVNIEYACIQGLFWISFCGIVSYAAVYLQARGYSNSRLGQILATGYVLGFLLSQILANWIDRSERITVYHCQGVLLALQVILVSLLRQLPGNGLMISVFSIMLIGTEITLNPMITEICADLELRLGHINYGAARGTGSIAFAPFSVLIGMLLERKGTQILPTVYYLCIALQATALLLLCLTVHKADTSGKVSQAAKSSHGFVQFYKENRRFFGVLAGFAFLFFAHNLVNNYMINVVRNVNGDTSDMGLLSGLNAFMEVPMMFLYDRLLRRFKCDATVRFASSIFVLKILAIAFAPSMTVLFSASVLQMFSFAMITPAMVIYVNLYIDHKDSAKGQALAYGMVTLGNVLSSAIGGLLFDSLSVRSVLLIGASSAFVGAVLCHGFSRPMSPKTAP